MGCSTVSNSSKHIWPVPPEPEMKKTVITPINAGGLQGYFISYNDASNLTENVENLKAYTKKLQVLVNTMVKNYGDKIEEQKP